MNLGVVIPILLLIVLLRVFRARTLFFIATIWIGMYVTLRFGFRTPIPHSALQIYMSIASLALLAYSTSSAERARDTYGPIYAFATERRYTLPLVITALAIPALVAWGVYRSLQEPIQPPFFARTVHPSPPNDVTSHGQKIDLLKGVNPLRELEKSDTKKFQEHVEKGRETYYKNCFFCHGDALGGDGMFAHALSPVPANFQDSGVLPMFQETFFFWRIAKGGPGMPDEGAPGDSVMPEWERFLSNDEIWEVILFLYSDTGYRPRTFEEGGAEPAH
jgi:cbb3-type cytochrome c oxidase subunit III